MIYQVQLGKLGHYSSFRDNNNNNAMGLRFTVKAETLQTTNTTTGSHSVPPSPPSSPSSPRTTGSSTSTKYFGNVIRSVFAMVMATMVLVQTVSSSSRLLTFQGLYDDVANGLMTGQYDFSNTIPITTTTTTTSSVGLSSTPHHHDPHSSHHAHGNEWFLTTLLPGAGRRGADDGAISCDVVQERVQSGQWEDPNHGQLFLRQVITKPSFYISVHNQEYDRIRYNSIFETGDYYEVEVRERFEYILGENQKDWDYHHSKFNHQRMPLVVDIGGNIGYYTLLSAAWKHAVVTF